MVNIGFKRLDVDHSIYMRNSKTGDSIVGVHVDDMAAMATDTATLNTVVKDLQKVLDIVNMGPVKWFLGMEVVRNCDERTITLSQAAYVDKIARRFGLKESYGVSTPLDPNVVLSKDMCPQTEAGCRAVWLPITLTCRICHDAQYRDA
jgi:hypothetical protein